MQNIYFIISMVFLKRQWLYIQLPVHSLCISSLVAKSTPGNNWQNNYMYSVSHDLLWPYNSKFIQNTRNKKIVYGENISLFQSTFTYEQCKKFGK